MLASKNHPPNLPYELIIYANDVKDACFTVYASNSSSIRAR